MVAEAVTAVAVVEAVITAAGAMAAAAASVLGLAAAAGGAAAAAGTVGYGPDLAGFGLANESASESQNIQHSTSAGPRVSVAPLECIHGQ